MLERQLCLELHQKKNQRELDLRGHCAPEHVGGRRFYQSVRERKEVWDMVAERKPFRDPGWRKWLPTK